MTEGGQSPAATTTPSSSACADFDPDSPTKVFQLSPPDFLYSVYRPDLAALGAIDGRPASGRPQDNNDALSRREAGLEFLDVTGLLTISLLNSSGTGDNDEGGTHVRQVYTITNNSSSTVDTHLLMIARGLAPQIELENASGKTSSGDPYLRVFLPNGVLLPGQSITKALNFERRHNDPPVMYTLSLLSGQGTP